MIVVVMVLISILQLLYQFGVERAIEGCDPMCLHSSWGGISD